MTTSDDARPDPSSSPRTEAPPFAAPLTNEEFDALDDALDTLREQGGLAPHWEFCEGFMTAAICTRRPIDPTEVWPILFGDDFVPAQHMEFIWNAQRRWNEIETALDNEDVDWIGDERCLQPACVDVRGAIARLPPEERDAAIAGASASEGDEIDPDKLPGFGQVWALGFMTAVRMWEDEWAPPRDKEAAAILADAMDAIQALADFDTDPPIQSMLDEDGPPSVSQRRMDEYGEAIWAVYDLRQLWRSLGPRTMPVHRADTPGRNDPCPCGSGKKYKKCHGA